MSPEDCQTVAASIGSSSDVKRVTFVGGEPTLYLDLIERIQGFVQKKVEYAIVTNGSWTRRIDQVLSRVRFDEIVLSFDKFHEDFMSQQRAERFIDEIRKRGVSVALTAVYQDTSELARYAKFALEKRVAFRPGRLSLSGRARDLTSSERAVGRVRGDELPTNSAFFIGPGCPAFDRTATMSNQPIAEASVYLPRKGFTICCGPLVFDGDVDPGLFASSAHQSRITPLAMNHKKSSLASQFEELGLSYTSVDCTTRCDACAFLHAANPTVGASLAKIARTAKAGRCLVPLRGELPSDWVESLGQNFSVRYVYRARVLGFGTTETTTESLPPSRLLESDDLELFLRHFKRVCKEIPKPIGEDLFRSAARFSSLWPTLGVRVGYERQGSDGELTGSLLLSGKVSYPEVGIHDALVVAWWGLEHSALSGHDSMTIKKNWMTRIREAATPQGDVVALVHHHNRRGRRFAESLGFELVGANVRWEST